MKCTKCGAENRPAARFCIQCGATLATASEAEKPKEAEGPQEALAAKSSAPPEAPSIEQAALGEITAPAPSAQPELAEPKEKGTEAAQPQLAEAKLPAQESAVVGAETAPSTPPVPESEEPPLPPGSLLQGRYQVIELLERRADGNLYAAYDLRRCPSCGFEQSVPDNAYCEECGASLVHHARCRILQKRLPKEPGVATQFAEGEFIYSVALEEEEKQVEAPPLAVHLVWAGQTDVGRMREKNEDYVDWHVYEALQGPTLGLFVVADGVGGQEQGEVASELTAATVWAHLREAIWEPGLRGEALSSDAAKQALAQAVQAANRAVYDLRMERHNDMGTTITAALLLGSTAIIANVGDSRTYLWNANGLRRISVDHSLVERLVAGGSITREEVYTHPQRNLIYRSLGDRPDVEVDLFVQQVRHGDRLLLCSDGLWEMVRDEGIEEMMLAEPDPTIACAKLIEQANLAGGDDNISVIIVKVEERDQRAR